MLLPTIIYWFVDPTLPAGSVMYTNGIPYTYQNGLAVFQSQEGGYPAVPQAQIPSQVM